MALSKSLENSSGVATTYHHISRLEWSKASNQTDIVVSCFVSESARQAGKQPVESFGQSCAGDCSIADCYAALKASGKLSGAQDA